MHVDRGDVAEPDEVLGSEDVVEPGVNDEPRARGDDRVADRGLRRGARAVGLGRRTKAAVTAR
jgi:hypothetical protein